MSQPDREPDTSSWQEEQNAEKCRQTDEPLSKPQVHKCKGRENTEGPMADLNKGRFQQSKDAHYNPAGGNQQEETSCHQKLFEPFDLSSSTGKALAIISVIIFSAPAYFITVIVPAMLAMPFIPFEMEIFYFTTNHGFLLFLMFISFLIYIIIIAPAMHMEWVTELYLKYIISVFYAILYYFIIDFTVLLFIKISSPLHSISYRQVSDFFNGRLGSVVFIIFCIKIWIVKFPRQN